MLILITYKNKSEYSMEKTYITYYSLFNIQKLNDKESKAE